MDWRLFVNTVAGIIGMSYIIHYWLSGEFKELRWSSYLCFAIILYYTFMYSLAIEDHISPETLTLFLRPFTGILLFLLGLNFKNMRDYYRVWRARIAVKNAND